ncbi:MAG: TetR/AcrR family transcriptional regulator [Anaerolineae bacterium]|jgi:AcrR family transcriptional regulator|nr:TetR/AcrR family transcriptional regulator [Anaerolineae bacterium]
MTTEKPSLRELCVREALAIIEADGLENLSLREVARRLGVSHQAPYRHYPSRDHLLAEVIRRAYEGFAVYLDSHRLNGHPSADLHAMGEAYLRYALAHPLQYRLMFGTSLPAPAQHPDMLASGRHAFDLLRHAVERLHDQRGGADLATVEKDALFIWSALHGLAGILQSGALATLDLSESVTSGMVAHTFQRIGVALGD